MSPDPIHVSRKEFSSETVLDHIDDGRRVIVTVGAFGAEKAVVLRKTDGEYVCDTGFKLLAYDDRSEMKRCIERLRLATGE